MESGEDLCSPAPVFVDDTGRRRVLTRRAGRALVAAFATYIGLMVIGFARDPRVGPIHLPTFGLPSLGLVVPPAPAVLGEQASRSDPDADVEVQAGAGPPALSGSAESASRRQPAPAAPGSPVSGGTGLLTSASGGAPLPDLRATPPHPATTTTSATTTTTARNVGNGPKSSTTTTSSTTTSTTTTLPSEAGRGPEEDPGAGTGPVSAKGPDGSGAPGQQRKPTAGTGG